MMPMIKRFLQDRSGATVVEYGIIVALLSLTIIGSLGILMNVIGNNFEYAGGIMSNAID
jgi:pilus assembly protein Flp/PilA